MATYRLVLEPSTNKIEMELGADKIYLVEPSTNLIINGGGENTTDWTDYTTTGLGDWWLPINLP